MEFRGTSGHGRFALGRDAATLDALQQTLTSSGQPGQPSHVVVSGRPGTATMDPGIAGSPDLWILRWQPVDGIWARLDLYATDSDALTAAANGVLFDSSLRCAVPFRLAVLPAGSQVEQCSVDLSRDESETFAEGSLVVGDEQGRWLTVRAQRAEQLGGRLSATVTAGSHKARWQGADILESWVEPCAVEIFLKGKGQGYAASDALEVLGGFALVDRIDDLDAW
ncbi:hypothetical protein B0I29_12437 [Actinoplanes lutulentus]|uniref:Uncharacterized protein n=1 Tax=Actinoplanes lutulentus TaxID=1287878 RepID=A0A327Z2K8_9ACTN|nr:hypothetical protein B0I29_12437 [Actinoplanes lutulentus]